MTITMDILTHLEQVLICLDKLDHTTLLHPINWNDALKKTVSNRKYGIPRAKLNSYSKQQNETSGKLTLLNALKLRLITLPSSYLIPQGVLDKAKHFDENEPTASLSPISSFDMKNEVCVRLRGTTNEMRCNIPMAEIEGYLEKIFDKVNQLQQTNYEECNYLLSTVWPNFGQKMFGDFDINPHTGVCDWPKIIEDDKKDNFLKSHFNEFETFLKELYPEFRPDTFFMKRKENPRWGYNPTKGRNVTKGMVLAYKFVDDFYRRCSVVFEFKRSSIGEKIEKFLQDRELIIRKEDGTNTFKTEIFYQSILQLLAYDTDSGFLTDARRFFFWKLADVDETDDKESVSFDFIHMDSWYLDINDQTVITPWLVFLFCFLRDIDPTLNDQRKQNFKHFVESVIVNSIEERDTNMDDEVERTMGDKLDVPLELHDVKIVTKPSVLEPAEVMDSNYFTKVMIFDTPYFQMKFRKYFGDVEIRSSKVVLKIYDRVKIELSYSEEDAWSIGKEDYRLNEFVEHVLDLYFGNELKALEKIESHNERYGEVRIKANKRIATGEIMSKERVTNPEGTFSTYDLQILGPFILLEYVPSDFNNITDETVLDGIRQLREMANIGVYNWDIKPDNLRFHSTGNVTFIDFSHCKLFQPTTKLVKKYLADMVECFTQSLDYIREKYEEKK